MEPEKQRAIASKGGKAAHQKGTAHQFSSEEARLAGSKGGRAARQKRLNQAKEAAVQNPFVLHQSNNRPENVESPREAVAEGIREESVRSIRPNLINDRQEDTTAGGKVSNG